jgi:hypothetical protein
MVVDSRRARFVRYVGPFGWDHSAVNRGFERLKVCNVYMPTDHFTAVCEPWSAETPGVGGYTPLEKKNSIHGKFAIRKLFDKGKYGGGDRPWVL